MTEAPPPPTEASVDASPPPPPAPRPPWRRTVDDRVLGGVAGGLARTLGVDAVPVRIGLVVLGVLALPLVLAYVAAWLLVPEDDAAGGVRRSRTDAGFWLGVALLAIVVVALAASLDGPGNGALVALALVGVGAALWRRDPGATSATPGTTSPAWPERTEATAGSGGTTTAPGTAAAGTGARPGTGGAPVGPGAQQPPAAPPPSTPEEAGWVEPEPPVARRRSVLGPVTVAVALIATGIAAGLDGAGVVILDPSQVTAVAMAVLGLGLLVGTVIGRARWLFLVALLLLPVVAGGSLVRVVESEAGVDLPGPSALRGGAGERSIVVGADDTLPTDIGYGVGELQVDLRAAATATDVGIDIDVALGELRVLLPDDLAWDVTADVGLGEVSVVDPDDTCGGTRSLASGAPARSVELRGGPGTGPVLDVDAAVAIGEIVLVCPGAA